MEGAAASNTRVRSYRGAASVDRGIAPVDAGDRLATAMRAAAALLGLTVAAAYLAIALSRLTYPFTIEWLESNSLVEVHRILAGQQLYTVPSVGYVPDGYPPLYFAFSAAVASVLGPSYLSLRLVSLVSSLACFALLGRLVQRETGSASAGIAAAGVAARLVPADLPPDRRLPRVDHPVARSVPVALARGDWRAVPVVRRRVRGPSP